MMNKRGTTNVWLIGILVLLVAIGGTSYFLTGKLLPQTAGVTTPTGTGTTTNPLITQELGANACPDTKVSNANLRLLDQYGNPKAAISGVNITLKDATNGVVVGTVASGSGYTALASVPCGSGRKFKAISKFHNDTSGSAESIEFEINNPNEYVTLFTNKPSFLNMRVEDLANGDDEFMFPNNAKTTNASTFTLVNMTTIRDTTGKTNFSIGTDGVLQLRIRLQATTSNRYFTDEGRKTTSFIEPVESTDLNLKSTMCVEYLGTKDFDSNLEQVAVNRIATSDVKAGGYFTSNDLSNQNISNSHKCYDLNVPIDAVGIAEIDIREQAKGGINPSATSDVMLHFLTQRIDRSTQDTNTFITGFARDNSGKGLFNIQDARHSAIIDVD